MKIRGQQLLFLIHQLLDFSTATQWPANKADKIASTAGAGDFERSIAENAANDGLSDIDAFNFAQRDINRFSDQ